MDRIFKNCKGFGLIGIFAVIALIALMAFMGSPAMAGQGDKIWTASCPSWGGAEVVNVGSDGSGASLYGVAFPYDSNSQAVVFYVDATGKNAGDDVDYWGYDSGNTLFTTLSVAFSGGNTNYIHVADASFSTYSGVSYVVIDDGQGTAGWAELEQGTKNYDGATTLILKSGPGNLFDSDAAYHDLTGVTFAASTTRVFPMFKIGTTVIGATSAAKDNNAGLVAAPKGSPLLVTLQSGTGDEDGSGVTLHAVTIQYK